VLLAAPHGIVRRLLALTGHDQVFSVYPSVATATVAVPVKAPAPSRAAAARPPGPPQSGQPAAHPGRGLPCGPHLTGPPW
jgi:hypothetical protein